MLFVHIKTIKNLVWPRIIQFEMIEKIYLSCNSPYYHHEIWKYRHCPLLSYFPVVVFLMWLCRHILSVASNTSSESWVFISITAVQCVQIIGYIMAQRSYSISFHMTHYLISIITKTCMKTLNIWNTCPVYHVECVSKSILSIICNAIYVVVFFNLHPFLFWRLCEYLYSKLPSPSNGIYESLAMV